jgi:peptidoglycan/xylan/chitin deacetylase (PgdA/CDA1 family)
MSEQFAWPDGRPAAVSFSFDDARPSQLDHAVPILDRHGLRATFYVSLPTMEQRLPEWRAVAATGHEIGNHSLKHACSGNFPFSRQNCLEEYTLERMDDELAESERILDDLVGPAQRSFAYPCGQKFVGRGERLQSYVPLIARRFVAGRGFRDEWANDPAFCDLHQIFGRDMDATPLEKLQQYADQALASGGWLVLAGHDAGAEARQSVASDVLDGICRYAKEKGAWVDTVATIATYVQSNRPPL